MLRNKPLIDQIFEALAAESARHAPLVQNDLHSLIDERERCAPREDESGLHAPVKSWTRLVEAR